MRRPHIIGASALTCLFLMVMAAPVFAADQAPVGNNFSSNTVLLDVDQGGQGGSATSTGTAMFDATNLEPGSSSTTACIVVDFSGQATDATLTIAASLGGAGMSTLESQLTMNNASFNTSDRVAITPGLDTRHGSCADYPAGGVNSALGTVGSTLQNWSSSGPYTISNPVTNTWYKFTVSGLPMGDSNCAVYCNQTITVNLTWTLTTT
jgi:hypothetical protein